MIRAPRFRYVAARSASDAAAALADAGADGALLAGGTDLVPNMKRRQVTPAVLISLRRIDELREIAANGEATIGACTTLADIVRNALLRRHGALVRAAAQVATPLIRSTATIGGNLCIDTRCSYLNQSQEWREALGFCLKKDGDVCRVAPSSPRCWAVASSDTAPALMALDARVTLLSAAGGERELPLDALYRDDGIDYLAKRPDEVLTSIRIPAASWRSTYVKLRRRGAFDFPVLGVAAALRFGAHGVVEEARVVLGAVASRPLLMAESSMLAGKALTDEVIEEFADAAAKHAKPLDNTDFAMNWRKMMAKRYVADALRGLRTED